MIPPNEFDKFTEQVYGRLELGQQEYGDSARLRAPAALADEISEELLDVCGWAFFLWQRMQHIKQRAERVQ